MSVALEEDIFISQLCLRASLLNHAFQKKIRSIVEARATSAYVKKLSDNGFDSGNVPNRPVSIECLFEDGIEMQVDVIPAPPKTMARMKEKIWEYVYPHPKAIWPLSGNILDPVRLSIVCSGADKIVQVNIETN